MQSSNKMKNPILVTGGAGYIVAHACKALKRAGYMPVAYDNLVYGHRSAVKWGPLEEGDISDRLWRPLYNGLDGVIETASNGSKNESRALMA